ncbi:MAG: YkgJ family cysteine cluster protein [Flavobacteriales bacterium]
MNLDLFKKQAQQKKSENKAFFSKLKRTKPKVLDEKIHQLHDEVFRCTDCLECANCCKTTGPLFTDKDISRIAKFLRIRPSEFTHKYLRVDEDKDYVLKQLPCSFLAEDNSCTIYEVRPKACREFPHTDRIRQHQILGITQKNVTICPAVFEIVEMLKKSI